MADFGFEFWKRVDELLGGTNISTMASEIGMNYQTVRNQRSLNRYPKNKDIVKIAEYLKTTPDFLIHGDVEEYESHMICEEAIFVQNHPEARALIRAIMDDPALLYPISALVTRKVPDGKEKEA